MKNKIPMFPYNIESLTAQIDEVMKFRRRFIASVDHVRHI